MVLDELLEHDELAGGGPVLGVLLVVGLAVEVEHGLGGRNRNIFIKKT